jgi:NAD dependent epimerase/dehydratase family enzyme
VKVVLPGGSGQVGTILARSLAADGHEVVVLGRGGTAPGPGRAVRWDARTLGPWAAELDGADAVIGLAGRSVDCRYTPPTGRRSSSRASTRRASSGQAIAAAAAPRPCGCR